MEFACASEMTFGDGVLTEPQDVVGNDVLLPVVATQPSLEPMLATSTIADSVLTVTSGKPAVDSVPIRFDNSADEVISAHLLSQQRDDAAAASRQSA